jgi:restriction endonuclease R xbaI
MDYMQKVELLYRIIANYRSDFQKKILERKEEMESDNNDHYLLYNVLGFTSEEGYQVDFQQNVGRFLYKYAGSLMEDLVINCLKMAHSDAVSKVKLKNTIDRSPKTVEIDCLIGNRAIEIKWKDATTDGDHIKKEHKRVRVIKDAGYIPIRLMFFEPNRERAIRIQIRLKDLYEELGGEYYSGAAAWEYLKKDTGIDLRKILKKYGKEHGE